ncbi:uncharacterized protein LOC112177774 [Rosa chinensis]|uniref:uncharacterized protein LOC112177774 n=1 Tax=Rosa chinensis TaxID=74649 RepID=UPI000D0961F2|nr:uncharacterized protein LOC112177774 [Rosa chinensis]
MCPTTPVIHHLLFVDDCFLFGKASVAECRAFKKILTLYVKALGQHVNLQKSSVVFSCNVPLPTKNQLEGILGVECGKEHGLYLGLPIHVGHNKTAIFAYLKERLTKKLINWRTKLLSVGVKGLLIKVVAQTLPNYLGHYVKIFSNSAANSFGAVLMTNVKYIGDLGRECASQKLKEDGL